MLHDISPHIFDNTYLPKKPTDDSVILFFDGETLLLQKRGSAISFPRAKDILNRAGLGLTYLFSIDQAGYYIADKKPEIPHFSMHPVSVFRAARPEYAAFAGSVAFQLYRWYRDNRFCGRCAAPMQQAKKERMLHCDACGLDLYPRIAPAVIVGVIDGDRIVLSKYAGRTYSHYALIAGFTEIGESIEQTVHREVMEEVGLKVKNIRFYKSQPWPFSDSLLLGFFADLDGGDTITLDTEELSEAAWFKREDVAPDRSTISLTAEMMRAFRDSHTGSI